MTDSSIQFQSKFTITRDFTFNNFDGTVLSFNWSGTFTSNSTTLSYLLISYILVIHEYVLKYADKEDGTNFGIKRPLKVIEKNKHTKGRRKQNELSSDIHFALSNTEKSELVVFETDPLSESSYEAFTEESKVKPIYLPAYDPNFWEGYNVIEPNQAIKDFKSIERDLKILNLERKIALEEIKHLKHDYEDCLKLPNWMFLKYFICSKNRFLYARFPVVPLAYTKKFAFISCLCKRVSYLAKRYQSIAIGACAHQ